VGLVNGWLETVGARLVSKPIRSELMQGVRRAVSEQAMRPTIGKAGVRAALTYAEGVTGEVGTEVLQEVSNIVAEGITTGKWDGIPERLGEIASKTAQGMALLGLPGPIFQFHNDVREVQATQREQQHIARDMERAAESKLRQEDPEAFRAFIGKVVAGTPAETVYIDGKAFFDTLLQQDQENVTAGKVERSVAEEIEALMPGIVDRVRVASERGEDVTIPYADFLAKLSGEPVGAKLQQHARLRPSDASTAELAKADPAKMAKEAEASLDEQVELHRKWQEEAKAFEDGLHQQILATGRMGTREARTNARTVRTFVEVMAERMGETPAQFAARYPLAVKAGEVEGGALMQFAGQKARTAEGARSAEAVRRLEAGEDAETVRKETGWHRGPDGGMRFEIDDSEARFKSELRADRLRFGDAIYRYSNAREDRGESRRVRLGDIFDHPKLFAAYPELADVQVAEGGGVAGSFRANGKATKDWIITVGGRAGSDRAEDILAHEIQHAIQRIEGFNPGANPAAVGEDAYIHNAGEVEARNTTTRRLLSDEGRRNVSPERTADVPTADVLLSGTVRGALPNDPNILRQEGAAVTRGGFSWNGGQLLIRLTPESNASTFTHESAHAFLSIYADLAAQKAHPTIVDDFRALLAWGGIKDESAWQAMTLDEQRGLHEKFAREFEAFLWEGKAPAPGLRRLFSSLMRFMRRVYATLQEIVGVREPLPADIRAVMERMLASDQEVRLAQAIRGAVPLFATQEESGLDDAAWAKHVEAQRAADTAAVDQLALADQRNMRWLSNAKAGRLRELQQQESRVRAGVRSAVAAKVQQEPVYRAERWLRTGEMVNADGTHSNDGLPHRMSREAVRGLLGREIDGDQLKGMLANTGYAPDDIAGLFDYRTGGELVQALLDAKPIESVIDQRTDAEMIAKHSDLADPKAREQAVNKALASEARRRFSASELSVLLKAQQPVRVLMAAAKQAAETALGKRAVRDINPKAFAMAARRASRMAEEAHRAGKIEDAIAAKRRQMVQEAMAELAVDAEREIDKAAKTFGKFDDKDKNLAKSRDIDYVYAGRALAGAYGLAPKVAEGQPAQLVEGALTKLAETRPDLSKRLSKLLADAGKNGVDYRNMPLDHFREVADVAALLWDESRAVRQIEAEGKRQEVSAVVDSLIAQINRLPPRPPSSQPAQGGSTPPLRSATLKFWSTLAGFKQLEHLTYALDGGKVGPFTREITQRVMKATAKYDDAVAKKIAKVHPLYAEAQERAGAAWFSKIRMPETDFTFDGKHELLHALLLMGSESGARKWLLGERGADGRQLGDVLEGEDGTEVFDTSRWDRDIARLWDNGILTEKDAKWLTTMWGEFAELLPLAQAAHKARFGYEFETVEHRPMRTPYGTLGGGYVPARVDSDKAKLPAPSSVNDENERVQYSIGPAKGFTITRNPNYLQPLSVDLTRLVAHMAEELRFIHLANPINDVVRILNGSTEVVGADGVARTVKMQDALDAYDRDVRTKTILPVLENAAMQRTTRRGDSALWDGIVQFVRKSASLNLLGFKLAAAMVQATGISLARTQVKGEYLRGALPQVLFSFGESLSTARQKSAAMRARFDSATVRLQQEIARSTSPPVRGGIKAAQQAIARWAFAPMRFFQMLADLVTWHGGYAQAIAENQSEDAAVQVADGAVRRAQGDTKAQSLAPLEVQTPTLQTFTQFGHYGNTVLNVMLSASSKKSAILWALLLPSVAEYAIRSLLRPPEDKDNDGLLDEVASGYARAVARNVAGMVPFVGPLAMSLAETEGARVQEAASVSVVRDAVRGIAQIVDAIGGGETTDADARAIASLLTTLTRLPIAAPLQQVQQLAK
jgi:hypothetical protein